MGYDNVFGINNKRPTDEAAEGSVALVIGAISRQFARMWCGIHGHLILMHFAPNKLSLQCALCGYESEGWEVGRPLVARRAADTRRPQTQTQPIRLDERRRTLHAVHSGTARMAS